MGPKDIRENPRKLVHSRKGHKVITARLEQHAAVTAQSVVLAPVSHAPPALFVRLALVLKQTCTVIPGQVTDVFAAHNSNLLIKTRSRQPKAAHIGGQAQPPTP